MGGIELKKERTMKRFCAMAAVCGVLLGCGRGSSAEERDIRGNYALTYDNQLKLHLNIGGAVREATATGYGDVVDFGVHNGQPVKLNLKEFCDKPEVKCPSEQFWPRISVDQPELLKSRADLQLIHVIDNTTHSLPTGKKAPSLGGLVNHDEQDRFVVGLGIEGGAANACAAIAVSLAAGRFSREGESVSLVYEYRRPNGLKCSPPPSCVVDAGSSDGGAGDGGGNDAGCDAGSPVFDAGAITDGGAASCSLVPVTQLLQTPGAPVDGIKEGRIGFGWAGGCAFGPFLVGATLYLETGYTAKRTGAFDPPPYMPAPVVLPDGGFPDGGSKDGG
jgi:hypothetical protein